MNERKSFFFAAIFAVLCAQSVLWPASARAGDPATASSSVTAERVPKRMQATEGLAHPLGDPDLAYFTIALDPRLCPSPLCGGYFVARVNEALTTCADGMQAPRCYVATLDLSLAGLSPTQEAKVRNAAGHALVRGYVRAIDSPPFGKLGVLLGQEVWLGHTGIVASGTFYRARNTGIVCIAFPCPIVKIAPLNRGRPVQRIAGVDLRAVATDPSDGNAQLGTPEGLLVAGALVPVSGPAGGSALLAASEYYLPVKAERKLCGSKGLSACAQGEFCDYPQEAQCGRADVPGICEVPPQACTLNYDPVCGCDGHTYGSACAAHAASVSVDHSGPCS